jgi:hypothetical protein
MAVLSRVEEMVVKESVMKSWQKICANDATKKANLIFSRNNFLKTK